MPYTRAEVPTYGASIYYYLYNNAAPEEAYNSSYTVLYWRMDPVTNRLNILETSG